MKHYSTAYANHLRQPVTTLAICWRIVKNNGGLILGTSHDRDIPITVTNIGLTDELGSPGIDLNGTYLSNAGMEGSDIRAASDGSVGNMEATGAVQIGVTIADLEAGLLDAAQVTTFRVNWQDPDDFQEVMRHGFLGEIRRKSEGEFVAEVRGLNQLLQKVIGRTVGEGCDVEEFGDARCKLDVPALAVSGTVTSVESRRRFNTSLSLGSPPPESPYFRLGKLTWLTGENVGFVGRVKIDNVEDMLGNLEMVERFPMDVSVGDTFLLQPGCDRRYVTCRDVHNNLVNFRGPGIFCPGPDEIIRAP